MGYQGRGELGCCWALGGGGAGGGLGTGGDREEGQARVCLFVRGSLVGPVDVGIPEEDSGGGMGLPEDQVRRRGWPHSAAILIGCGWRTTSP